MYLLRNVRSAKELRKVLAITLAQLHEIIKLLFKGVTRNDLSVIFQILFLSKIKNSSNENVCCDFYQSGLDLSNTIFSFRYKLAGSDLTFILSRIFSVFLNRSRELTSKKS